MRFYHLRTRLLVYLNRYFMIAFLEYWFVVVLTTCLPLLLVASSSSFVMQSLVVSSQELMHIFICLVWEIHKNHCPESSGPFSFQPNSVTVSNLEKQKNSCNKDHLLSIFYILIN